MIVIRCNTGKDVEVAADELIGANLANLDLHKGVILFLQFSVNLCYEKPSCEMPEYLSA